MIRQIIKIDHDKCEGCGTCITECTKGAIELVNGKATLTNAEVCDSLGACIPKCPMYAISLVQKDVLEFDNEKAINERLKKMLVDTPPAFPPSVFSGYGHLCPCMQFKEKNHIQEETQEETERTLKAVMA